MEWDERPNALQKPLAVVQDRSQVPIEEIPYTVLQAVDGGRSCLLFTKHERFASAQHRNASPAGEKEEAMEWTCNLRD
ncbi:hypothetical protein NDU88_002880 [Pleurodeles waltl]|uniref:Uncharacterized protein n=1 Tax=Pleurodeles waltl TaxID=8319 RepID=A0AAV7TLX0_PLEWA|nr:hypothetical protein NDU88_002880 [Pleurodeles waltl]